MIELTKAEAESLAEYIEFNIFQNIRDDTDADNIDWLCNIVHVYEKCRDGIKEADNAGA